MRTTTTRRTTLGHRSLPRHIFRIIGDDDYPAVSEVAVGHSKHPLAIRAESRSENHAINNGSAVSEVAVGHQTPPQDDIVVSAPVVGQKSRSDKGEHLHSRPSSYRGRKRLRRPRTNTAPTVQSGGLVYTIFRRDEMILITNDVLSRRGLRRTGRPGRADLAHMTDTRERIGECRSFHRIGRRQESLCRIWRTAGP